VVGRKILLVEGKDDEHVLKHLCGTRCVGNLDEVKEHGSVDQLLESIPVRLKASEEGDIVGIVIDADSDLAARWASLRDRLINLGYRGVIKTPEPAGTVLDPPADKLLPRVGVWIMPNNQLNGILEDFLLFLVPTDSRLLAHVQGSVDAIPEGEQRFKDLGKPKAVIHTWLAWQKEPGKPLGTAITAEFLDPSVAEVDVLVSWLRNLLPAVASLGSSHDRELRLVPDYRNFAFDRTNFAQRVGRKAVAIRAQAKHPDEPFRRHEPPCAQGSFGRDPQPDQSTTRLPVSLRLGAGHALGG
jgi:hypothetical protein